MFEKTYTVRWADMDPNGHMRHSAYNDYAAQHRIEFLAASGFTLPYFAKAGLGPILFREDTRFLKELHINEALRVGGELSGLNADGSRWNIVHTLYKPDGRPAATVSVEGAWLDLRTRKLTTPPPEIAALMAELPRHESYREL
ncbi:thioesterase family protein [Hymenobacter sp. ISL-91]|uniref:acyl-CoA thioesterase n=1 Tax=Hymenobacter sp. ISL-91 TaxID=2819151 RepID=UPI001BE7539F|nr:thioesterase family protein [Hymenobacter sp. ISL-91]MBT2558511.1 thioesterase family protein [Hymenobacter sp. ISL-91]